MKKVMVLVAVILLGIISIKQSYAVTQTSVASVVVLNSAYVKISADNRYFTVGNRNTFFQVSQSTDHLEIMY